MDNHEQIPVFKPFLGPEEIEASKAALELGWLGMGSYVGEFEAKVEAFLELDERHAVAMSTGHAAIHLALMLIGVGPGDEVITPSFNNIADFQAIMATGAEPVFCDIDPKTLSIDLDSAAALISPRTKVIIAMDYFCHLCDHSKVAALAREHNLRVIHDAAHSFGSLYGNTRVGSFSDITMFSFDPVKTITTIDGGMLIVRSEEEKERLHEMRLIGMGQPSSVMYGNQRAWTYDVSRLGFRYHMANLHAAIGLAQLAKMPEITASRQIAARYYVERLRDLEGIDTPSADFGQVVPFSFYILVKDGKREALREHLRAHGVDTGIHWQPGHIFSLFRTCRRGNLQVTERIMQEVLSIPFHSAMPIETQDRVIDAIRSFYES